MAALLLAASSSAAERHSLTVQEQAVVHASLRFLPELRPATRDDCRCDAAVDRRRKGGEGAAAVPTTSRLPWPATLTATASPTWRFCCTTATAMIGAPGVLAIFNGPLKRGMGPASFAGDLPLEKRGLFVSTAAPHVSMFGRLSTATVAAYVPFRRGYREDCSARIDVAGIIPARSKPRAASRITKRSLGGHELWARNKIVKRINRPR